jgi:SAM-dependent methyltransferase
MEQKFTQAKPPIETPKFWEEAWKRSKEEFQQGRKKRSLRESVNFWNQRAENFGKNVLGENGKKRVSRVFNWLESQGVEIDNMKVLDIGAGPGAFTLAFAERAQEVVALEPATAMTAFIKKQVAQKEIKNIRIIEETWEEVDLKKHNLEQHFDLVFASMSPGVNNRETLDKALSCAKQYCFISSFAGKRRNDALSELWQIMFGENVPDRTGNIIYIFNLLYARGFDLSFKVWEEKVTMENTVEEAVLRLERDLQKYDIEGYSENDPRIKQFVEERVINGVFRQEITSRLGQILVRL